MRLAIALILLAYSCHAANTNKADKADNPTKTNKVDKVEKEHKADHTEDKIIIKARDKGSKKEKDWKTEREIPLMFHNNKKAKKVK